MDTLPHNGAVITLLAVTGLTHQQAYKDIFAITLSRPPPSRWRSACSISPDSINWRLSYRKRP